MKIQNLKLVCTVLDPALFPKSPRPEIAVAGRSNVGKSSLLNTVIGRRAAARISKQPGKTQTINFYLIDDRFHIVDLPGYGYAKVSATMREKWKRAMFSYIEERRHLSGVVQLVDARHPPSKDDLDMMQRLIDAGRPFIVVLTKADKIRRSERSRVLNELGRCVGDEFAVRIYRAGGAARDQEESGAARDRTEKSVEREHTKNGAVWGREKDGAAGTVTVLFFSSKTGEGKDTLWRWIQETIA